MGSNKIKEGVRQLEIRRVFYLNKMCIIQIRPSSLRAEAQADPNGPVTDHQTKETDSVSFKDFLANSFALILTKPNSGQFLQNSELDRQQRRGMQ
jgi:hypothetical protein